MVDKTEKEQPRLKRLREIEEEMCEQFQKQNIFEQEAPADYSNLSHEEKNKTKYMATFPFPYMNGNLHLGHGYTITKAEFQVRYQRQIGKKVLFPFGFHCTGMPIQAAANRLKREIASGNLSSNQPTEEEKKKNPKIVCPPFTQYEIMMQLGVAEADIPKFQDPFHWFDIFPEEGRDDLKTFGIHTDWRRSFFTTEKNPYYDQFVRWQFNHLKANNKITYAKRFTIFSQLDNQPCADHDRAKGEGVAPQEYVGIKIELLDKPDEFAQWADKKIYMIAATLRCETMFGQTNCFVLPEGEYGLFEMKNDEYFVMSERAARNMAFQEMTKEDTKCPALAKIMGAQLVGRKLKTPLTSYEHVYMLPLTTISMTKGTGIVTSVPSDSPDDYAMLFDLQTKSGLREKLNVKEEWVKGFDPIPIIEIPELGNMCAKSCYEKLKIQSHKDEAKLKQAKETCYQEGFYKGIMMVGPYKGAKVEEAKPLMKEYMLKENMAVPYWEPEGEVVSRSGDQCIVALKFQWLLSYGEEQWKADVRKHVDSERFNTYNPKTKQEFDMILDWLKEWGCSRTAGLGTKLPWDDTFVVESLSDSTIYMAYYTVAHLLQGGVLDGSKTGPLGIKPEDMTMAAWDYVFLGKDYNAAECPNVSQEQLQKMRHEFEFWYPMDLRVSGKDLIRNHLTMSLYNHASIWKDNLEQRMTRSYFCNGYLLLNGKKMSKSTGNFMTLKQSCKTYGVDATRLAMADSGDLLDDANFDTKVANAAILKIFVLEEWLQKHCPKEFDWNTKPDADPFGWDNVMMNETRRITKLVKQAYTDMRYRDVIKYGFNELSGLKEIYLLGTGGKPNPVVLMQYLQTMLTLLNPVMPHFCQYQWQHVLVPAIKSCQNVPKEPAAMLVDQGWPSCEEPCDDRLSYMLSYLQDAKSNIRLNHMNALKGDKKKKPAKGAPAEEQKVIANCTVFYSMQFPEYQKVVLGILSAFEFDGNQIKGNGYIAEIRAKFTVKKEADMALKFAAYVVAQAAEKGKEQALSLSMPFNEAEILNKNHGFLFENMPTITSTQVCDAAHEENDAKFPNSAADRAKAVPGQPVAHYW